MAAITTGVYGNGADSLYLKKIDKAFFEEYDRYPEEWSKYLNDRTGKGNNRVKQIMAGIAQWEKKNELDNPAQKGMNKGPNITTYFDPYAIDVVMSREQYDDALWDDVEFLARDAGQAGRETVERECATVLDNAFSTSYPIYDGKPLCADDHPLYGKEASGTGDNKITGALNDANLKTGLLLFDNVTDESGKKIKQVARKLIVPPALQFIAQTILQSQLITGSANNDKNVLNGALQPFVAHYLTNDKQWFIQGDKHELNHFWRVMPEFKRKPGMEDNHAYVWKGYFRHGINVENWRGIVGSTGL